MCIVGCSSIQAKMGSIADLFEIGQSADSSEQHIEEAQLSPEETAEAQAPQTTDTEECAAPGEQIEAEASADARPFAPGSVIDGALLATAADTAAFFTVDTIPNAVFKQMQHKSFKDNCTTKRSDLRYVRCLHWRLADNNDGGVNVVGEMVLNRAIANEVVGIFRKLHAAHYPIERMELVDKYNAEDEASMAANNSSGFNFRFVSGSKTVSKHGKGLAVDINPLYNPCRRTLKSGEVKVEPAAGRRYADRKMGKDKNPYKLVENDLCYRLFRQAGFIWGGNWRTVKDYQHFEK